MPFTHKILHEKMAGIKNTFEESELNRYEGPKGADLVVVASGAAYLYAREAIDLMGLADRVGVLKIGTTFPLPEEFITRNLKGVKKVARGRGGTPVSGSLREGGLRRSRRGAGRHRVLSAGLPAHLPGENELSADIMALAIAGITGVDYVPVDPAYQAELTGLMLPNAPYRSLTFCAGCPHRASYWGLKKALKLDGRDGVIVGDIGCYTIGLGPQGYSMLRTTHAMGSGSGLASGLGQLGRFGLDQPVLARVRRLDVLSLGDTRPR